MNLEQMSRAELEELARLMEEEDRRKRENKLASYCPYPKQREFHDLGASYRERMFSASNQSGKALRHDEPVLTPGGWIAIANLRVGDSVIAGDGSVTVVTGVYPQGIKPVFKVEFDDGASVHCCEDHLWAVKHGRNRFGENRGDNGFYTMSLRQIRELGGDNPDPTKRVVIPVAKSVQLNERPLPLDPYLLGVLLGDGGMTTGGVSLSNPDAEIISEVRRLLPDGLRLAVDPSNPIDHHIYGNGKKGGNAVINALRELGLFGLGSHDKFIPDCYLFNSHENRLAMLQGLMDTDGSCGTNGAAEFSTTSDRLAEGFIFLARSLGAKIKAGTRQTWFTYKGEKKPGRVSWRIRIRMPHWPIFRLSRKQNRYIRPTSTSDNRVLYSITPAGEAECVCISVAHESRTFATKDFIVTHNSHSSAMELAMHLTGQYPSWWGGRRFNRGVRILAGSESAELTKRGIQRLLLGPPESESEWGTGSIPKSAIVSTKRKQGVPDALDSIVVKHVSGGNSSIQFSSYDQGRTKWQADTIDIVALDEEPPEDVYFEALTRTNATGGMVMMTFTPLKGITGVVKRFSIEKPPSTVLVRMSLYECGHYTKEQADAIAASYPEHERKARVYGEPVLGEGAVFPVPEESIIVNPFQIPAYWPQIIGLDFGWDHPAGAVLLAWDRDNDTIYVTRCYRERQATPVVQAAAIKAFGDWIPVAWPHDGHQHDKGSGIQLAKQYRDQGLKMMVEHSKFPDGSIGFEAGISEMLDRMQTGRWKVFRNCDKWLEEFRMYHREKGLVVKEGDDLLSASRVGMMSIRFARVKPQQSRVIQSGGFAPLDPSMGF